MNACEKMLQANTAYHSETFLQKCLSSKSSRTTGENREPQETHASKYKNNNKYDEPTNTPTKIIHAKKETQTSNQTTDKPTSKRTNQPIKQSSIQPINHPTTQPTTKASIQPTNQPVKPPNQIHHTNQPTKPPNQPNRPTNQSPKRTTTI